MNSKFNKDGPVAGEDMEVMEGKEYDEKEVNDLILRIKNEGIFDEMRHQIVENCKNNKTFDSFLGKFEQHVGHCLSRNASKMKDPSQNELFSMVKDKLEGSKNLSNQIKKIFDQANFEELLLEKFCGSIFGKDFTQEEINEAFDEYLKNNEEKVDDAKNDSNAERQPSNLYEIPNFLNTGNLNLNMAPQLLYQNNPNQIPHPLNPLPDFFMKQPDNN